jgi:uncharacterized repeat protein (TIGR02543 family)
MSKLKFLLVLFAIFTFLTACTGGNEPIDEPDGDTEPEGPFTITVDEEIADCVSVDKTSANEGETVTITVNAPKGKTLELSLRYFYNQNDQDYLPRDVDKVNNTTYTFTMPKGPVKITGTFENAPLEIYSAEVDGTVVKWDANIYGEAYYYLSVYKPGDYYPSASAEIEKDKNEFDLSTIGYFSDFIGKLVNIKLELNRKNYGTEDTYTLEAVFRDDNLPVLNAPTDLKVENNTVSWKWVDVNHECGGFIVTVNGKSNKLQYYPYYNLPVGFEDQVFSISVCAQGVSGKSNASEIVTIEYDYKVPVYDVTFYLNDGTHSSRTIKTVGGKIEDYIPERAGYIFNGWYTSNDDGVTLQRRYTGEELITSNLDLYADWVEKENTGGIQRLPKPKVSVLGSIVRWSAISGTNGYQVQIILNGVTVLDETIDATQVDVSDYVEDEKYVTFKVRARGDGETTANSEYTTVSVNTAVSDKDFISKIDVDYNIGVVYWKLFDNVAYYVNSFETVLYDKTTGECLGSYSSNYPEFVLTDSLPAGTYKLEIYMYGLSQTITANFDNIRLSAPEFSVSDTGSGWRVSWEAVRYADCYEVIVNGVTTTVSDNFIDVPYSDKVEVSVRSKQSDSDYIMSRRKTITIEREGENAKVTYPDQSISLLIASDEYTIDDPLKMKNAKIIFTGTELTIGGKFSNLPDGVIKTSPNLEHLIIANMDKDDYIRRIFSDNNVPDSLKTITIASGIDTINYQFDGMVNLETVNLGTGITRIKGMAFYYCSSLKELNTEEDLLYVYNNSFNKNSSKISLYDYNDGCYYVKVNGNPYYIYLVRNSSGSGRINSSTKVIASEASNSKDITGDLILPEGLVSVGNYAFSYTSISSVVLPSTLKYLGDGAFYDCKNLTQVTIPASLTKIGGKAFKGCTSLTDLFIHNKITKVGADVVNTDINQVTLENGVYYLGTNNNPYFIAMKVKDEESSSVTINENCVVLSDELFYYMYNLEEVNIPESVKYYGSNLFSGNQYLKEISITNNNAVLDIEVFKYSYIDKVYFAGTKAEWASVFNGEKWFFQSDHIAIICTDGEIDL